MPYGTHVGDIPLCYGSNYYSNCYQLSAIIAISMSNTAASVLTDDIIIL